MSHEVSVQKLRASELTSALAADQSRSFEFLRLRTLCSVLWRCISLNSGSTPCNVSAMFDWRSGLLSSRSKAHLRADSKSCAKLQHRSQYRCQ
eukprot:18336-Heterococcus_DN1.PRE.3